MIDSGLSCSRTWLPAATMSAARASATATKSTMAVCGECNPLTPETAGSSSPSSATPSRRNPATWFARARASIASSRPSCSGDVATTTLPISSYSMPLSWQ